jgi:hypothetical protein
MISFPALFLALAGATLLAALIAIWNSIRATLGGGARMAIGAARDLPGQEALADEKSSLLRAIKDLEYERAVGKIGDADFQRLDAAYRARAKQVLAQLDRDVKPLYQEAEQLIEQRIARGGAPKAKKSSKAKVKLAKDSERIDPASAPTVVEGDRDGDRDLSEEEIAAAVRDGRVGGAEKLLDLPDEVRAQAEAFVAKALAEHAAKKKQQTAEPVSSAIETTDEAKETARGDAAVTDAASGDAASDEAASDDAASGEDEARG